MAADHFQTISEMKLTKQAGIFTFFKNLFAAA
jgi:hypothetical protein